MGLADLIFGTANPFSQYVDTNQQKLAGIGAGLASGQNFSSGLSNAVQGAQQGGQADRVYALSLADQKARMEQIAYERQLQQNALGLQVQQRNATADWVAQNGHPELADAIRAGAISGGDVFAQMYKNPTFAPPGSMVIPNDFNSGQPNGGTISGSGIQGAQGNGSIAGAAGINATAAGVPRGPFVVPPAPAPGYRNNPDGTQSAITGGPGDPATIAAQNTATERSKAQAAKPEQRVAAATSLAQLKQSDQLVSGFIDKAIQQTDGMGATGWLGKLSEQTPGTPGYALAKTLDTVRANIGFDKLQAMRAASPSGGALGQVSNFEEQLLQSVLGSLDQGQDAPTIKANLQRLKDYMAANDQQRLQAFQADFGGVNTPSGSPMDATQSQPLGSTTSTGVQWSFSP